MSLKLIFQAAILSIASISVYAESQEELDYKPDELIVRFKKDNGKSKTLHEKQIFIDKQSGGKIKKSFKRISDLHVIELPKNLKVKDALKKYKYSKEILYVEPNYKLYLHSTIPNDPYFSILWGLHNTGQEHPLVGGGTTYGNEDADIDAPEAWDIYTGSQDVIVAVLDSGIDYIHPDLFANMWVNQAELIGDPNSDDDGNGYKDDIYGYDFADSDSDPNDYYLHGTHVAGTIGAVGNNNTGVSGVCWGVRLMSVKIFPNYGETTFTSHAIEGIEYAIENGAKVLNNSWGGHTYSNSLSDAINDAKESNVLFVVSAGNYRFGESTLDNDIDPVYPASYDCENIISVLATNSIDEIPWWSHCGATKVDIGAPGDDIFSTFPTYMTPDMQNGGFSTDYETINGTSMAAPHISGACALVWSMYPHYTYSAIKDIILKSVDKLDSLEGLCVSEGRLNVHKALLLAHPLDLEIERIDPNTCVVPWDSVTFEITYGNPTTTDENDPNNYIGPAYNTEIHFTLPQELEYSNINDPNYNLLARKFIWDVGTLDPNEFGTIQVTLQVTEAAEPMGVVESTVKMYSSIGYGQATEETEVCCWGGGKIYVNVFADGYETGVDWENAYTDLQDALARAGKECGNEIWVAKGIYYPTDGSNQIASFEMVEGVDVYGGFAGNEPNDFDMQDRQYIQHRTYLSGNIDTTGNDDSLIVVRAENISDTTTVLDGFIITYSAFAGVSCDNADIMIRNCAFTDNDANGLYCFQSSPAVSDSIFVYNGVNGIYDCNESNPIIERCILSNNGHNGIRCIRNASLTVNNSWIHHNFEDGIQFENAADGSEVRNNTIVYNELYGVSVLEGTSPTIKNCILWGNSEGALEECSATYSCFETGNQGTGNIDDDPNFAYENPSFFNFHLHPDSLCRDAGDSASYTNETDIDGDSRVVGSKVDMGADEIYCEDAFIDLDWNADGVFNYMEYEDFSKAWLSCDPNVYTETDPNIWDTWVQWGKKCDLYDDGKIDLLDLELFLDIPWIGRACWFQMDNWIYTLGEVRRETDQMAESQSSSTAFQSTLPGSPAGLQEQIDQITEIIDWLETIWAEDPQVQQEIDTQQWNKFMDSIYEWFNYLDGLSDYD